jgi:hypothetical protein
MENTNRECHGQCRDLPDYGRALANDYTAIELPVLNLMQNEF